MKKFNLSESYVDIINKDYLCDHCKHSPMCKDYTGVASGKKYHHIYCERFSDYGKEKTD